jgi:hypothetical protein
MVSKSHTDEESLTTVPVDRLTRHERRVVIPSCDYVVVTYDSSYSDKPESTCRIDDPVYTGDGYSNNRNHGHVSGKLVGANHDDDESYYGIGGNTLYKSTTKGRIGKLLSVAYPAPEPSKTHYRITFRVMAGNWSTSHDDADDMTPAEAHGLSKSTADKYSWDNAEPVPEGEARVEDVQITEDGYSKRRASIDLPVSLVVADDAVDDVADVIERARKRIDSSTTAKYDSAVYREDLPPCDGSHIIERDYEPDKNLRAPRYIIDDVRVETVD